MRGRRLLLLLAPALLAGVVAAARRARLAPMLVEGESMLPTLRPGQRIAVGPLRRPPPRGALVVLRRPRPAGSPPLEVVKRVVGLPGERVPLDGGVQVTLGPDEYFVLGDNLAGSTDGRAFGPVPASALVGRVRFAYWPPRMRLRG
jgi:signal peptidase I